MSEHPWHAIGAPSPARSPSPPTGPRTRPARQAASARAFVPALRAALGPLAAMWLWLAGAAGAAGAGELRAGAATSNITPPLGSSMNGGMQDRRATHVHDQLHARALVLDDGDGRLAIVVCDSCMIPREICDRAKGLIQDAIGLSPDRVLISATHTHSAATASPVFQSDPDPGYAEFLAARIADAVRCAVNNLAAAQIGWGVGSEPNQVFNRRWRMKPGTIPADPFGRTADRVRMNPPVGSPDLVEPAGPTDPDVSLVAVRSRDGTPLALLANYSLHYVGGTGAQHLSADYFAAFADRIQELLGADRLDPPFVGIMSNGTSGDINNINFRGGQERRPPYGQIRLVADAVAREAFRVAQGVVYQDGARLDARQTTLELAVRRPEPGEVAAARAVIARAKGPVLQTVEEVYARETVLLSEYPETVTLVLQAMRIGDLGIAAIPCEVFAQIGLDIKRESALRPTFTIELANGYNGYLPTPDQHRLGGYETWRARSSYLEVEASTKITAGVLELLNSLASPRTR